MKYVDLLTFINDVKKEEFLRKFVQGAGSTKLFSRFATDPKCTSDEDKEKLRKMLKKAGIPAELISTDDALLAATKFIMARAVKVR
ncbi:hypothetical protein IJU85_02840 [Candidatus Saccharibacteria bacterium]|nr:hypothetical protein [Candidatus Saccharibacteria bacterium]